MNWTPCRWQPSDAQPLDTTYVELVARPDGPDRYAVRKDGLCLNKRGKWEYEPMPSSRTDAFLKRCRFDTFAQAEAAYLKSL